MAKRKKNKGQSAPEQGAKGVKGGKPAKKSAEKKSPWARGAAGADTAAAAARGAAGADTAAAAARGADGDQPPKSGGERPRKSAGDQPPKSGYKPNKKDRSKGRSTAPARAGFASKEERREDYGFSMSHAPRLDEREDTHWIQFIPAALFTAVVILLVRQYSYARDMSIYYWSSETAPPADGAANLVEFFSHYKTELIGWSVLFMGIMIGFRMLTQRFAVKRSVLYWPMLVYIVFTVLSCAFSDNPDVAWDGWNDRFEGTAMILCYYAAIFFIMNSVNSERNIKYILYPVVGATLILSAIGLSQATGHDFFQTAFGQKLITPNVLTADGAWTHDLIDQAAAQGEQYLKFTFQNNEIYQTVYNINYVSFYLTLLIPLYAMLFIWAQGFVKKLIWGAIFGLVVFNFFGAASAGGMLGMAAVIVLVVVVLRKRLIRWWQPVLILVVIVLGVGMADIALVDHNGKGVKWIDELRGSVSSSVASLATSGDSTSDSQEAATAEDAAAAAEAAATTEATTGPLSRIDYFINKDNTLEFSVDGNKATLTANEGGTVSIKDSSGNDLALAQDEALQALTIGDERFANVYIQATTDEESGMQYLVFRVKGEEERTWPFALTGADSADGTTGAGSGTLLYRNDLGKYVALEDVPHIGFENDQSFGSGRGYIWSRSLPLIKDTIFIGTGADTYCIEFPHLDYVGKYNAGWNINMIVDKPHNMYIAVAINTGLVSLIALLALFLLYIIQSIRLYWRREFTTFAEYAGAGIFFGVTGFVVSAVVDDSTVSVMPLFYGLFATGIAVNIMLRKRYGDARPVVESGSGGPGANGGSSANEGSSANGDPAASSGEGATTGAGAGEGTAV